MSGFQTNVEVRKVDAELGLVIGWAIVCKEAGVDYYDTQGDHIPEDAMLKAATDFMENSRTAGEMHNGEDRGQAWVFPMTGDIAKALGVTTERTGLAIVMKPDKPMLEKFKSGELTGFSIGGERISHDITEM